MYALPLSLPCREGMDLTKDVSARQTYKGKDGLCSLAGGYAADKASAEAPHVVAIDYGIRRNILRNLVDAGARVTVLPATATFAEILAHAPDGLFLSDRKGVV